MTHNVTGMSNPMACGTILCSHAHPRQIPRRHSRESKRAQVEGRRVCCARAPKKSGSQPQMTGLGRQPTLRVGLRLPASVNARESIREPQLQQVPIAAARASMRPVALHLAHHSQQNRFPRRGHTPGRDRVRARRQMAAHPMAWDIPVQREPAGRMLAQPQTKDLRAGQTQDDWAQLG